MEKPVHIPINEASGNIVRNFHLLRSSVETFDLKLPSMLRGAESIQNEGTRTAVTNFFVRISGERKVTLQGIQEEIDRAFPYNQPLSQDEYKTAISLQDAFRLLKNLPKNQTLTLQELQNTIRKTTEESLPARLNETDRTTAIATFCGFLDHLDMTIGYVKGALDAMPEDTPKRERIVTAVRQILESHLKLQLANLRPPISQEMQERYHEDSLERAVISKLHAWAHQQMEQLFNKKS